MTEAEGITRMREQLVARFPNCFKPKGTTKRSPLKIGIREDILKAWPEAKNYLLIEALEDYTSGPKYLRNVVAGAPRVCLDGTFCGEVTPAEAAAAKRNLRNFDNHQMARHYRQQRDNALDFLREVKARNGAIDDDLLKRISDFVDRFEPKTAASGQQDEVAA